MKKIVLITGASSGIGRACAQRLASAGWTVLGTSRRASARADIEGIGAEFVQLDVSDAAAIQAAIDGAVERHGRLDALVANAGIGVNGCFEDIDEAQIRQVFEVNVFGAMGSARAALPHLRASRGRLVVISSIAGRRSAPGSSIYNASKFAIEGWGEGLRFELAPLGVPVVLIQPGPTESGFFGAVMEAAPSAAYRAIGERLAQVRVDATRQKEPVETVSAAVERALTEADPPFRIATGRSTKIQLTINRLLPWVAWERLVSLKLRLPKGG